MTDKTLRPDQNNVVDQDIVLDKTIVIDRVVPNQLPVGQDMPAQDDVTDRTLRPDIALTASKEEEPVEDVFVLKGETYRKISCLSDNSGEAQIFLVRKDAKDYVLKVYYPNFDINRKLLQVIRSFRFEMIVRLYDYGKTWVDAKNRNYELMEYLRGGTLQDYGLGGDINQFRRLALQGAAALAFCHQNNILHKDIKPSNFFFRDEDHKELVLGDFGISSIVDHDTKSYRTTQARTPIFAAPEMYADVIDGEVEITPAVDYYSLGMTLFALWLGENPMSANERVMMRQKNEGRLPRIKELPDPVRHIVQGLTTVNPLKRWTYKEVEKWFLGEEVAIDISSPFLKYKTFIVDPERNLAAENVHELIPLLIDNERLAVNYLYNGRITAWLESCGNSKLATAVKDIVTNRYPVDQKAGFMAAVYTMEPTYPYTDVKGMPCDDMHSIALSLLSNQQQYALMLQNPNDPLFLYLEIHTKNNIDRLRSYFKTGVDSHVAIMRLVYEIDTDIPFLSKHPSASTSDIVRSFGYADTTEDDWHSLCDGRLLSWMYSHEDMMPCESLRILTKDEPYSRSLAYKVLYDLDRNAAYDLREARTPEDIGRLISKQLMQTEHLPAEEFEHRMQEVTDPKGRFYYYAQLHGWHDLISEATHCFDLKSEENRERMGAYDLRTALYRFCRILGATPTYMLADGTELTDGKQLPENRDDLIRNEIRNGSFLQWLAAFYHEDPTRDFAEEYSYERELEEWIMRIGRFDGAQMYYRRFVKAQEDTKQRIKEVRRQWQQAKGKESLWRYFFYGACAVWAVMLLLFGTDAQLVLRHTFLTILLPVGGMTALIVGTRAYFKGYGFMMSALFGLLGYLTAYIPLYILNYIGSGRPLLFTASILGMTAVYMLVCHFTDFRKDQQSDSNLVKDILSSDDVKTALMEPLYYTFKTRSNRYKSTKFSLLDDVTNQVRSFSGETVIHYLLWGLLALILIGELCLFSPKLLNRRDLLPGEGATTTQTTEITQDDAE